MTTCTNCSANTISLSGATICTVCEAGTVSNQNNTACGKYSGYLKNIIDLQNCLPYSDLM